MSLYTRRPPLTSVSPYFPAVRQAQYAASAYRPKSDITVLVGPKCRSEAQAFHEARGRYPVYVQKVVAGNPHKEVRVDDDYEMAALLQSVSWRRSYVVVRPSAPPAVSERLSYRSLSFA